MQAKQADGGGHGQFKEVGCATQGRRAGDAVLLAHTPVQSVCQARVEQHLNQDPHGQYGDDQQLLDDGLTLEGKEQDQGQQQCLNRPIKV